jgi:hypothetical protein
MNQKANSIADLAAVLLQQERGPTTEQIERSERRVKRAEQLKRQKGPSKVKKKPILARELGGTEGVMVRWANILDAEFAETWPVAVVHDVLGKSRYTAAFPPAKRTATSQRQEKGLELVQTNINKDEEKEISSLIKEGEKEIASLVQPVSASEARAPP